MQLHLAQFNVATLRRPMDHPDTAQFAEGLAVVNALAESTPGFVWRLQTDEGDATSIVAYDDPLTIVNLTVWESVEALREFAYRGLHRDFFRRRGDWFQPGVSGAVMWWIPSGTLPTVDDACRRLDFLRSFGPSPYAFGTGQRPAPLVIVPREIGHPDVVPMIERLNRELIDTEPEGGICHLSLDHEELLPGDGAFFAAYLDGAPRACGAYRRIDDASAEVKRMWADPAVRGSKLGAAVLSTIVGAALADGYRELRLETGEHLTAAVGLYTKVGFTACEPWGEYKCSPSSHCMSMRLTAEPFRQG